MNLFNRSLISGALIWFLSFAFLQGASANNSLKSLELHNGDEVTLGFDGKLESGRLSTEYFNDIIQISFSSVTVYPAKVKSSSEGLISKVFVYQYTPKIVRCRISVRGHAEAFKKNFQINTVGKTVHLKIPALSAAINPSSDLVQLVGALKQKVIPETSTLKEEQRQIQEKVEQVHLFAENKSDRPISKKGTTLGGAKSMPSFGGVFLKLVFVVGLFSVLALGFKKLGLSNPGKSVGVLNAIQKAAGIRLGAKQNLIEVLSTQQLGPKKSISVVKVAGRTLVLGLSQDSIHLITQISGDANSASELEDVLDLAQDEANPIASQGPSFSDVLTDQKEAPSRMASQGVRSRIRSRLEGLKPL
jgi:flagellar biogenesis protein FliO